MNIKQLKMVIKTPLSSTDPVRKQSDTCNLDYKNENLQKSFLNQSCSMLYHWMMILTTQTGHQQKFNIGYMVQGLSRLHHKLFPSE